MEKTGQVDLYSVEYTSCLFRGVAQPGSAPALGAGSRRFKSSRPDHSFLSPTHLVVSTTIKWPFGQVMLPNFDSVLF